MKHVLLFILLISFGFVSFAQTGTVVGKITNGRTNEAVVGAAVTPNKGAGSKVTDVEGRYSFKLAPGTYSLRISSLGMAPKTISEVVVSANQTAELNIVLEEQTKVLNEVVVSAGGARRETVASVLNLQKNNTSVSDGISSELIKRSPDANVGEVLKRVTGTSVQDDKYVIVRGLNDRYNVATINGAVMPSTEPDRRTFSFDVVPSSMIDNVLINKTATPDMPGEFSGGIVQVTTKDIPYRKTFGISIGAGYNSLATFKNFEPGFINPSDYLGFDDGSRGMPSKFPSTNKWRTLSLDQKIQTSRLMRNNYGDRYDGNAMPLVSAQVNFGTKADFNNGGTFGVIGSVSYKNSQNFQSSNRLQYNDITSTNNTLYNYEDSVYSFSTSVGALLNVGYKKGRSKVVFKNLFNRIFENSNTLRQGFNYNDNQYVASNAINVTLQKMILSSQLEGEHSVSKKNASLKWNLNYALTQKDQPDYRVLPYQKSLSDVNNKNVLPTIATRNTYRFWSDLLENTYGGKVDFSAPANWGTVKTQFKAGVLGQYKTRDFDARSFRYEQTNNVNSNLVTLPAEKIFNDGNMYANGFYLNEITNNTDKYDAFSTLGAAYVMFDNKFNEKWRAIWGVRYENFGYEVEARNVSGTIETIDRNYHDILPSLNLIYSLNAKSNIRFSGSRTVSRPDFREVANFSYFDYVRNAVVRGNNALERSQTTNVDLRFETYPRPGEIISASLFFKHFAKPIEQVLSPESTPEYQVITFANPDNAVSYGVEIDFRKRLTFIGDSEFWDNLLFSSNVSVIASKVKLSAANNPYDADRPMQGQSPYLLNAALTYSKPASSWSGTLLFNRIGQRIETVGGQIVPDVYENGRSIMDFQVSRKVLKAKGELKFNVSNLLDTKQVFYNNVESLKTDRAYKASEDRIQWSNRFGRTFSLAFTYNFN